MQVLSKMLNAEIDVKLSLELFHKFLAYVNHILAVETVHFKCFTLPKQVNFVLQNACILTNMNGF
jgi:hypothetical protein